jgi:hypothetical protein
MRWGKRSTIQVTWVGIASWRKCLGLGCCSHTPVDIADQNYPGTASYFDSPIWAVLRGDQLNQRWIDDQLKALAPAITDLLMVSAPPMLQAIPQPDRFQKFD